MMLINIEMKDLSGKTCWGGEGGMLVSLMNIEIPFVKAPLFLKLTL